MITNLLRELQDEWGYTTEELNSIREKMEELAGSCYWDGYNDRASRVDSDAYTFYSYGKKEDFE